MIQHRISYALYNALNKCLRIYILRMEGAGKLACLH